VTETSRHQVTELLHALGRDESGASDELLPLVYNELRRLARGRIARERGPITLQPTALVHEAYIRLVSEDDVTWRGRGHFFGAAALAMRRILCERARYYQRLKHGGHLQRQTLEDVGDILGVPIVDLIALDEALKQLEQEDPRMAKIVTLRFFAGLSVEEVSRSMDVSTRTVKREWRIARLVLHDRLAKTASPS